MITSSQEVDLHCRSMEKGVRGYELPVVEDRRRRRNGAMKMDENVRANGNVARWNIIMSHCDLSSDLLPCFVSRARNGQ